MSDISIWSLFSLKSEFEVLVFLSSHYSLYARVYSRLIEQRCSKYLLPKIAWQGHRSVKSIVFINRHFLRTISPKISATGLNLFFNHHSTFLHIYIVKFNLIIYGILRLKQKGADISSKNGSFPTVSCCG